MRDHFQPLFLSLPSNQSVNAAAIKIMAESGLAFSMFEKKTNTISGIHAILMRVRILAILDLKDMN